MLALRVYRCEGCDTVYADVEPPPRCDRCGETAFAEFPPSGQAARYFA